MSVFGLNSLYRKRRSHARSRTPSAFQCSGPHFNRSVVKRYSKGIHSPFIRSSRTVEAATTVYAAAVCPATPATPSSTTCNPTIYGHTSSTVVFSPTHPIVSCYVSVVFCLNERPIVHAHVHMCMHMHMHMRMYTCACTCTCTYAWAYAYTFVCVSNMSTFVVVLNVFTM